MKVQRLKRKYDTLKSHEHKHKKESNQIIKEIEDAVAAGADPSSVELALIDEIDGTDAYEENLQSLLDQSELNALSLDGDLDMKVGIMKNLYDARNSRTRENITPIKQFVESSATALDDDIIDLNTQVAGFQDQITADAATEEARAAALKAALQKRRAREKATRARAAQHKADAEEKRKLAASTGDATTRARLEAEAAGSEETAHALDEVLDALHSSIADFEELSATDNADHLRRSAALQAKIRDAKEARARKKKERARIAKVGKVVREIEGEFQEQKSGKDTDAASATKEQVVDLESGAVTTSSVGEDDNDDDHLDDAIIHATRQLAAQQATRDAQNIASSAELKARLEKSRAARKKAAALKAAAEKEKIEAKQTTDKVREAELLAKAKGHEETAAALDDMALSMDDVAAETQKRRKFDAAAAATEQAELAQRLRERKAERAKRAAMRKRKQAEVDKAHAAASRKSRALMQERGASARAEAEAAATRSDEIFTANTLMDEGFSELVNTAAEQVSMREKKNAAQDAARRAALKARLDKLHARRKRASREAKQHAAAQTAHADQMKQAIEEVQVKHAELDKLKSEQALAFGASKSIIEELRKAVADGNNAATMSTSRRLLDALDRAQM
jgi:hypothetical protein